MSAPSDALSLLSLVVIFFLVLLQMVTRALSDEAFRVVMQHALAIENAERRNKRIRTVAPAVAFFTKNTALMNEARRAVLKRRTNTHILKTLDDPHAIMMTLQNGANASALTQRDIERHLSTGMRDRLRADLSKPANLRRAEAYASMLTTLIHGMKSPPPPGGINAYSNVIPSNNAHFTELLDSYIRRPNGAFLDLIIALDRGGIADIPNYILEMLYYANSRNGATWGRVMKILEGVARHRNQKDKDDILYQYFELLRDTVNSREILDVMRLGARLTRKALGHYAALLIEHPHVVDVGVTRLFQREGVLFSPVSAAAFVKKRFSYDLDGYSNAANAAKIRNHVDTLTRAGLVRTA